MIGGIQESQIHRKSHQTQMANAILQGMIATIIKTGKMPQQWREAIVIPIPKPKKNEYRPITLLCTAYKIFTKWIYKSIQQNIIQTAGPTQAGFIPKRSTYDQINYIRRIREKALEFNQETWIVLADVKSAFDTVNRNSLYTLLSNSGVSTEMIELIQDSMNGVKTTVQTKYGSSQPVTFNAGVTQGGPASGPLFTIPIAHALVSLDANHKEFCDDILMHFQDKTQIAPALQHIIDELKTVGMKLAPNKYEIYHIDAHGKETIYDITNDNFNNPNWHTTMRINNNKKSIRYLGDYLGPSKESTQKRVIMAEKAYSLLRSKLWAQKSVDLETKITVFKAIVMSTLLYGLKTHSLSDAKMKPLNWFCLRKLKSIFGIAHDAHTSYENMTKLLKDHEIKWKWPSEIIRKQRLHFFIHQIHKSDIRTILLPTKGLKRKIGGPKRRMIDAIHEDIELLYDSEIRQFDYKKHGLASSCLAEKILYYCHLHANEIQKHLERI